MHGSHLTNCVISMIEWCHGTLLEALSRYGQHSFILRARCTRVYTHHYHRIHGPDHCVNVPDRREIIISSEQWCHSRRQVSYDRRWSGAMAAQFSCVWCSRSLWWQRRHRVDDPIVTRPEWERTRSMAHEVLCAYLTVTHIDELWHANHWSPTRHTVDQ